MVATDTASFQNVGLSYDRPLNLDVAGAWSESIALALADKEGITLTPAHWEVFDAMRNHFQEYGVESSGRDLMRCLEAEFAERGGKKYLYDLFPRGPVSQASRIAGLPLPPHSSDHSFGTAM